MKKIHAQSGMSTLLLVLVLALLLELVFFSVYLFARLGSLRSATGQYSRKAYYAVEGGLHDTLHLLQSTDDWPPLSPFTEDFIVGDTRVQRKLTYDATTKTYSIDVGADFQDTKRRMLAEYQVETAPSERKPLDIMLVIDRSTSMDPILETVKQSLIDMVDSLELDPGDRIGVVTYSNAARIDQPLTTNFSLVKTAISDIEILGRTNISYGLVRASQQLDLPDAEPNRQNVVIFFTDGVANVYMSPANEQVICLRQVLDYAPNTDPSKNPQDWGGIYAPDNGGTECTEKAIQVANTQLAVGYHLYGVFYQPPFLPEEIELGSRTLHEMIKDPDRIFETAAEDELKDIFQAIAGDVIELKKESFSFQEVEPLPD